MWRYHARSTLNISRLDAVVALMSDQRIQRRPSLEGASVYCVPFHCRSTDDIAKALQDIAWEQLSQGQDP